jgi:hypothetical protein
MPDTLGELRAQEREAERAWRSLQGALLAIAELNAGRKGGIMGRFREMQEQAKEIDRRRFANAVRIAGLEAEDAHAR